MKKTFLFCLYSFLLLAGCFSMPGFTPYIENNSGEYVYYKDNSFNRESYIGILYYDESTFQIRYFAPDNAQKYLPELEISILISVNPNSDHWEMTGEKIITNMNVAAENIDIVNYLHDILYEFSARRIKLGDFLSSEEKKSRQQFDQFGGEVVITFDNIIPVFNIKEIKNSEGTVVLECSTTGQLTSSEDKSFSLFKGFPADEKKSKNSKSQNTDRKSKLISYKFNGKRISLDKDWEQKLENLWTLGDDAIITIGAMPFYSTDSNKNYTYIIRKLLQSSNGSYNNLGRFEITSDTKKNEYKITTWSLQTGSMKYVRNVKCLSEGPVPSETEGFIKDGKQINYFSISVFEEAYNNSSFYFDRIVRSYK